MPEALKLLIVDDHRLFRESLAHRLAAQPDFEVVGDCGTVAEAVEAVSRGAVDVVLLDIDLGAEDGGEFLHRAAASGFRGKVLVVTAGVNKWESRRLAREGTAGIFRKDDPPEVLFRRIREVAAGGIEMPVEEEDRPLHRALKPREREVLRLVFEGLGNKEIGGRLDMSESMVKEVLQQLFAKSGVRTRAQLVRVAIEKYWDELGLT